MKKSSYKTSPIVPGTMDSHRWDLERARVKDLVLRSEVADVMGVAEMTLNVSRMSAIAEDGSEQFVSDFEGQKGLSLYGIASGKNIRTKSIVKLAAGRYSKLRFYISEGSIFKLKNREERSTYAFEYLDFEFEGGLEIKENEAPEFVLRFNFVPFESRSLFGSLESKLKQLNGFRTKWAAWA